MTIWKETTPRDQAQFEPEPNQLQRWSSDILDGCWIAAAIITAALFAGFIYARYF